ncbi:hypothetical protein BGZ94_002055 [Podila epigama]|nr:hypothetical protein BGZ94_002055 [Podila epigama]
MVARAKFFVSDDEDDSEEESEDDLEYNNAYYRRPSEEHFSDHRYPGMDTAESKDVERVKDEEEEENVDGGLFMKAPRNRLSTPANVRPVPSGGMHRRQSLLSNLFMAEKQQRQGHSIGPATTPSSATAPRVSLSPLQNQSHSTSTISAGTEPVLSTKAPIPQVHHEHGQHQHYQQYPAVIHENIPMEPETTEKKRSPLMRTKKVFKNLDALASMPSSDASCTALPSPPPSPLPAPSSANNTSISPATALAAWTRSHQVQVQLQSLVVQSTSSAHRALLSASATLTDVLFRTK